MAENFTAYHNLALSLAIGVLIGIERGWRSRGEPAGSRVAGIRTFGLIGLIGGVIGLLGMQAHPLVALALTVAAAATLIIGYAVDMRRSGTVSATTTIAALLTLGLGGMATSGFPGLAVAAAAVTTMLLALRGELHGWLGMMSEDEVKAVARFALISLVVLPLLPDRAYGPYDAWNPHDLWLVVVLVCGFSFAGYIASRSLGAVRGALATAATGAIVSSTAVTAALARRLKEQSEPEAAVTAGIAIASAVMFVRVMVLTGLLARFALPTLMLVTGLGALVSLAWGLWSARQAAGMATKHVEVRNPFELMPALGLAAMVAIMALIARWALHRFGDAGLATVLSITGIADVDAAIITMGGLPAGMLDAQTAGLILAGPIILNSTFKAAIVISLAGWQAGRKAAMPLVASIAAVLASLPLML